MAIYEYKCPTCGDRVTSMRRVNKLPGRCSTCGTTEDFQRVWSVALHPPMQEHFNQSVGKPISSMRQYSDELKRVSAEASERTGIEHRYVPVDMNDKKALGVDGRGIDESNRVREKAGADLLPDIT